jgi:hypothetical protein
MISAKELVLNTFQELDDVFTDKHVAEWYKTMILVCVEKHAEDVLHEFKRKYRRKMKIKMI